MSVKTQLVSVWKATPFKSYIYFSVILNLVAIGAILSLKTFLPPVSPLFYGRPMGENQLVGTFGLLIAPGVSIAITLLNLFFISRTDDDFLKKIFASSTFLVSLLTTISILKIIFLVGFF